MQQPIERIQAFTDSARPHPNLPPQAGEGADLRLRRVRCFRADRVRCHAVPTPALAMICIRAPGTAPSPVHGGGLGWGRTEAGLLPPAPPTRPLRFLVSSMTRAVLDLRAAVGPHPTLPPQVEEGADLRLLRVRCFRADRVPCHAPPTPALAVMRVRTPGTAPSSVHGGGLGWGPTGAGLLPPAPPTRPLRFLVSSSNGAVLDLRGAVRPHPNLPPHAGEGADPEH